MLSLAEARNKENAFVAGEADIIVVGAGHAGCEAALAAARLGPPRSAVYDDARQPRKFAVQSQHRRHGKRTNGQGDRRPSAARWGDWRIGI